MWHRAMPDLTSHSVRRGLTTGTMGGSRELQTPSTMSFGRKGRKIKQNEGKDNPKTTMQVILCQKKNNKQTLQLAPTKPDHPAVKCSLSLHNYIFI